MRIVRKKGVLLPVILCLLVSGCIYFNVQRPLSSEFDKTELGMKTGQSSFHSVLWLFAWGDAGTKAAAENGGIKVIRHADSKVFSILFGLYAEVTTVVYGD